MIINLNDEQGIELLHWIFERELKPPFRKGYKDIFSDHHYYNRDGEEIGWLYYEDSFHVDVMLWNNIRDKICQAFEFDCNNNNLWYAIEFYLQSWLGAHINIDLNYLTN